MVNWAKVKSQIASFGLVMPSKGIKEVFMMEHTKKIFTLGEGLPGAVWKSQRKNEVWNRKIGSKIPIH